MHYLINLMFWVHIPIVFVADNCDLLNTKQGKDYPPKHCFNKSQCLKLDGAANLVTHPPFAISCPLQSISIGHSPTFVYELILLWNIWFKFRLNNL